MQVMLFHTCRPAVVVLAFVASLMNMTAKIKTALSIDNIRLPQTYICAMCGEGDSSKSCFALEYYYNQ